MVTCTLTEYLLQYIRGTVEMGVRFSESRFDMHVFTDTDWAGLRGMMCVLLVSTCVGNIARDSCDIQYAERIPGDMYAGM